MSAAEPTFTAPETDATKERPILFSAPMVRALLAGTKTQTRRPVKGMALEWLRPEGFTPEFVASPENFLCPYGFAGDHLWVRETFFAYGRWETRYSPKKGRDEWHFIDMTLECDRRYVYAVEDDAASLPLAGPRTSGVLPGWWRRPAIFMPRVASRILLKIAAVRVERLQDISEADAWAEGISACTVDSSVTGVDLYRVLWDSLNGDKPGMCWEANPWVWCVEFRVMEQGRQHAK